jgi:hypothetical protein
VTTGPIPQRAWLKSPALEPEVWALLACAQTVLDRRNQRSLQTALSACPSAERLCQAALAHGMLGLLYLLVVSESLPRAEPVLLQRLTDLQRSATVRSLVQTTALLKILDGLRGVGVQAMPIKGPVWAQQLYGDIALRTWSDLDLVVRPSDVAAARTALLDQGFVESGRGNELILRRGYVGGEMSLASPEHGIHLDLHWKVNTGLSPCPLTAELIFADAQEMEVLGRRVLVPAKLPLLLITCLSGDRWRRIESLVGLGVQLRGMSVEDCRVLSAVAGDVGCVRRVMVAVRHAAQVFDLADDLAALGEPAAWLAERAPAGWPRKRRLTTGRVAGPREELALVFSEIITEDSVRAGLRHLVRMLCQPSPADWGALVLPDWAWWLYYPFRPMRLCVRYLVRLARSPMVKRRGGVAS